MMFDANERAALLFVMRRRRSGVDLLGIVYEVLEGYRRHEIDAGEPVDMTPDGIVLWIAHCWETYGPHPVFPDINETPKRKLKVVK